MFTLRLGDITQCKTECIVNASNPSGLGCFTPNHPCIDNAIHKWAGPNLLKECEKLKGIPEGTAAMTKGHQLPARFIIHATGPNKIEDGYENHNALRQTYKSILDLAKLNNISEITFCLISSGMYGFDKKAAINTQIESIISYMDPCKTNKFKPKIILNAFTKEEYGLYLEYFKTHNIHFRYVS